MNIGKFLKDNFKWLAEKPSKQFTLGGEKYSLKFNRAGRFVERTSTSAAVGVGIGIAFFGFPAAIAVPTAASAFGVGVAVAAFGKAIGVAKGAIVHHVVNGISKLAIGSSKPKSP